MYLINWLNLQPPQTDLNALGKSISETLPARKVRQNLIEITLQGYPWADRPDVVPCYHPSNTFAENEWIALPIHDAQNIHPLVWQIVQVKKAEMAENPVQGSFQVLTLEIYGRQFQLACGIPDAPFPASDLSQCSPQDLTWLVEWVEDAYCSALQSMLASLVSEGKLRGKFTGDLYIPGRPKPLLSELSANSNVENTPEKEDGKTFTPPLAVHQRIWKILIDFLKKLFRSKS